MTRRRDMERLQHEVDQLLAELWQVPRPVSPRARFRPPVDCFRSAKRSQLAVVVELAGVDPEQLTLAVEGRELVVAGERRRRREAGRVFQVMEIEEGPFERRIPLDPDVDVTRGNARYERGLLTIVFPLAKPRVHSETVLIRVQRR